MKTGFRLGSRAHPNLKHDDYLQAGLLGTSKGNHLIENKDEANS